MQIVGIILAIIGFGIGILDFLGVLPQLLPTSLGMQVSVYQWAFWVLGVVGLIIAILNRRPRD